MSRPPEPDLIWVRAGTAVDSIPGSQLGDSLTYKCVDRETEILATRGWLRHDQVRAADMCLTLNTDTGMAEWQPVQSVHIFGGAGPYPVIRLENYRILR